MQYKIIQKLDGQGRTFEKAVGQAMGDGWVPSGGVNAVPVFTDDGKHASEEGKFLYVFTQALVKMN